MRRVLAATLVASLAVTAVPPRVAHGQEEVAEAFGFLLLFALDTAAAIGGTVTGIGNLVQLNREPPRIGWAIASIVIGGLAGLVGGITTVIMISSEVGEDVPSLWVFAAVPLFIAATNLTLGLVNLSRWRDVRDDPAVPEEEEYEETKEEEEWTRGPAPGVGLTLTF